MSQEPEVEGDALPLHHRSRALAIFVALLALGVLLSVIFGMRTFRSFRAMRDLRERPPSADLSILRPWMTVRMAANALEVPLDVLYDGLDIPVEGNERRSLIDLSRTYWPDDRHGLLDRIAVVVARYRAEQQGLPPPPDLPPTPPTAPTAPAVESPP